MFELWFKFSLGHNFLASFGARPLRRLGASTHFDNLYSP